MARKRIFLSVGDHSGDLHATNLMGAMRKLEPDIQFVGFGMEGMRRKGLEALEDGGTHDSAMWLENVFRLGHFHQRLRRFRAYLDDNPVDLLVPVDFGGFNLYLCREASRRGIPTFYYIPPQAWASRRYRLKKLRKWVTQAGLIYPFEVELFRRHGVDAEYVGHPLFDMIAREPPSEHIVSDLRERFGDTLIGIFPGSRRQEVRANWPVLLESCRRIRAQVPKATFAFTCPPSVRPSVEDFLGGGDGPALVRAEARPIELARASRLCITKSGTITLEIASQETPMVIYHRTSPLVCFLAYGLSHTPYAGLINNLAGRVICPEKPTSGSDPAWVADQALQLLQNSDRYEECRQAIRATLDGYAAPGASARAARCALGLI